MTQAEHSALVADILLEFGSRPGLRLWPQRTGAALTKTRALVRFGVPGQADIAGILAPGGRVIQIECKTGRGVQSKQQKRWEAMVRAHGAIYILARSVDDVRAVLGRSLDDVRRAMP